MHETPAHTGHCRKSHTVYLKKMQTKPMTMLMIKSPAWSPRMLLGKGNAFTSAQLTCRQFWTSHVWRLRNLSSQHSHQAGHWARDCDVSGPLERVLDPSH